MELLLKLKRENRRSKHRATLLDMTLMQLTLAFQLPYDKVRLGLTYSGMFGWLAPIDLL